ncbi:MAG TPA: glycosyltransferase family 4 protein [Flavipsychrobacter sp.]|nr:glycosyltransferase family 4 protein [Flavipsychrobacter sp.]
MKIAQVPPLYESVPPKLYGGTERVVSYLTEELVRQGHDVTLFASGDSTTNAELIPVCKQALRLDKNCKDPFAYHILQMQIVMEYKDEFDIIHFHNDYLHFPFSTSNDYAHVTTLHGRLDLPELQLIYNKFKNIPVVSISNNQRKPLLHANWAGTIYHGIPSDLYQPGDGGGGYLAFLGRISPEKRPDRAIEIAKRAGIKLKIAAKVDKADQQYYDEVIKPMLDHPLIEFIGEIGETEKSEFLGNALALLFPIDWPEPFGMVMIEAIANGTPIIAFKNGSVPEVVDHMQTGYIVNSIDEAVAALQGIDTFDRGQCRKVFEERFTSTVMARNYLMLYEHLIEEKNDFIRNSKLNNRQSDAGQITTRISK